MKNMQQQSVPFFVVPFSSIVFFFVVSWFLVAQAKAQPTLERLWSADGLAVPESVLYYHDDKSTYLFVSQIDGDPAIADGKGGVAKMTVNGELFAADWVTGLNAPKGMAIFSGKLYVADLTEIVVINIKKGSIEKKIPVSGSIFLNDVAVDGQGIIYVSDTKANKIYRVKNEETEEYLDKVDNANGIKIVGGSLIVGAGTQLLLIDKDKNRLRLAKGFAQPIDGVEPVNRGDFLVSCWPGLIYYVHPDGKLDLLLDTQQAKINAADIGYDAASQTVFVPNFSKNSVTAYHLTLK